MSGSTQCCVAGCRIRKREAPAGTNFHRFPKNVELCRRWLQNVGDEELLYLPSKFLTKSRFVCSKHFLECDYIPNKTHLKDKSIPSVFEANIAPLPAEKLLLYPRIEGCSQDPSVAQSPDSSIVIVTSLPSRKRAVGNNWSHEVQIWPIKIKKGI